MSGVFAVVLEVLCVSGGAIVVAIRNLRFVLRVGCAVPVSCFPVDTGLTQLFQSWIATTGNPG